MSLYIVKAGDTFGLISRKVYGTELNVNLIIQSNPGVSEPLTVGIEIVVPDKPDNPLIQQSNIPAENQNEVALKIEGKRFRFWESMTISRSMDSMDTLEFSAPFNVDDLEFRETFKPYTYKKAIVTVGGVPLFTGTMLNIVPSLTVDKKSISVNGYSLPGVLGDCTIPASAFPPEFNGQGLEDIAKKIASFFGLSVEFTEQQGPIFEKVAIDPEEKALGFLIKLAKQRNLVIGSTSIGKLLFHRSTNSGQPVARLTEGSAPLIGIGLNPSANAQEYYSHVTGIEPTKIGDDGGKFTGKNSRLNGVIRPFTFKVSDSKDGNLKESVSAKAGRMFANIAPYTATVSSWRNPQGNIWEPNTTITLIAPDVMVYSEYEFLIRSVQFSRDSDSEVAVLSLVPPETFKGEIPGSLPWD